MQRAKKGALTIAFLAVVAASGYVFAAGFTKTANFTPEAFSFQPFFSNGMGGVKAAGKLGPAGLAAMAAVGILPPGGTDSVSVQGTWTATHDDPQATHSHFKFSVVGVGGVLVGWSKPLFSSPAPTTTTPTNNTTNTSSGGLGGFLGGLLGSLTSNSGSTEVVSRVDFTGTRKEDGVTVVTMTGHKEMKTVPGQGFQFKPVVNLSLGMSSVSSELQEKVKVTSKATFKNALLTLNVGGAIGAAIGFIF
jgi:hypothetical protein